MDRLFGEWGIPKDSPAGRLRLEQTLEARRGAAGGELRTRSRGNAEKLALVARLRAETTMTVGWIAERLAMGSRGYLNQLLYRRRQSGRK